MRAYLSFVLVLFSLMLLFSMMQLRSFDGRGSIIQERTYLVSMNSKEAIIELLRQGAMEGFEEYDSTHRLEMCLHCPPCNPKLCDISKCRQCFREREAIESAEKSAQLKLGTIRSHEFDSDYFLSVGGADISAFSRPEPLARNGFALDSIMVNNDLKISVSSDKFGLQGTARIPGGMVLDAADN